MSKPLHGSPRILYITYHLPTDDEPGAFRPWVEARLLRESGYEVTVITSAVHYMTGKFIGSGSGWCREEMREGIRILRVWTIPDHRGSIVRRILNYSIFAVLAALAALLKVRKRLNCLFTATDPLFFYALPDDRCRGQARSSGAGREGSVSRHRNCSWHCARRLVNAVGIRYATALAPEGRFSPGGHTGNQTATRCAWPRSGSHSRIAQCRSLSERIGSAPGAGSGG